MWFALVPPTPHFSCISWYVWPLLARHISDALFAVISSALGKTLPVRLNLDIIEALQVSCPETFVA